jgi:hypothetical protein
MSMMPAAAVSAMYGMQAPSLPGVTAAAMQPRSALVGAAATGAGFPAGYNAAAMELYQQQMAQYQTAYQQAMYAAYMTSMQKGMQQPR